jgi:hypothetical protein
MDSRFRENDEYAGVCWCGPGGDPGEPPELPLYFVPVVIEGFVNQVVLSGVRAKSLNLRGVAAPFSHS